MKKTVMIAAVSVLLAACGGSSTPSASPSPSAAATTRPTKDVTYTSGSAEVTVSGAQQSAFSASLDSAESATFTTDDGFDVWWRTGDQALNVSGDLESGEADVFVRVETGPGDANAFIDPFHTICTVTLTEYTDTRLAGTFTCPDMPSFDGSSEIDANGTFSASA